MTFREHWLCQQCKTICPTGIPHACHDGGLWRRAWGAPAGERDHDDREIRDLPRLVLPTYGPPDWAGPVASGEAVEADNRRPNYRIDVYVPTLPGPAFDPLGPVAG